MRLKYLVPPAVLLSFIALVAIAQPPAPSERPGPPPDRAGGPPQRGPDRGGPPDRQGGQADNSKLVQTAVDKMMAFDVNKSGKLTKKDITDARLLPLFERADVNKKGEITKEELTAFLTKETAAMGGRGRGGPGGGPGGPPPGRGPGGPDARQPPPPRPEGGPNGPGASPVK